jgi:putative ABC transport system substrate-binding protein
MRRREFIAGLVGAAAIPGMADAQQGERGRRVGVLMGWSPSAPGTRAIFDAFVTALAQFGWHDRLNVSVEQRWTEAKPGVTQPLAKELVQLKPDVIFASTTPVTAALMRETSNIPIVFISVSDPVGAGLVARLSHPGKNITGFINIEAEMGGKWLQLLKELAPNIKRGAIMFNPDTAPGHGAVFLPSFEAAARSVSVEPIRIEVRSEAEIEAAVENMAAREAGIVAMTDSFLLVHRKTIITSSARNGVPVISDSDWFVREGGLMSYGPDYFDLVRRAASYVDRIMRGANASDLPVEVPTKWELFINRGTAHALGLTIPETLLATADEVIQ